MQKAEKNIRQFKRLIYVVKDIAAGEPLTPKNVRVIRLGDVLEPKFYPKNGRKQDNAFGTPLSLSLV
jgi:sialic acid synthase SpsE